MSGGFLKIRTCGQRHQPVLQNLCHWECNVGRLRHSHEDNVPSHRLKLRNLFQVCRQEKEPVTAFIFTCDGNEWCAADCSLHSQLLCNAPECTNVLVLRRTSAEGLDHEVHQPQSVSGWCLVDFSYLRYPSWLERDVDEHQLVWSVHTGKKSIEASFAISSTRISASWE